MTTLPPLPAVTADERATLVQFLDYFRGVLLRKVDDIDDAQARVRVGASEIDLLGLVRHLALVEQWWFSQAFAGLDEPDLWSEASPNGEMAADSDPDSDWHHTPDDTLAVAIAALEREIDRARAVVAGAGSLDQLTALEVGPPDNPERFGRRSLRWVLVHMIEEYARHCGHADILREAVDGTTGD